MRIAYVTAGAAGMYCGTCMHDNALAAALIERGHEVALLPTYTPIRTDEASVADEHIFFGAINVYLQQKLGLFRHTPGLVDRLLDSRALLKLVSRLSSSTDAADLGDLTLSMLQGEAGHQAKELDKLVDWLAESYRPEIVHLSFSLFAGFARRMKERLGVPVVCSLQGEDLFLDGLRAPYGELVRKTLRERARDVDAFTAPCRFYAERMSADYGIPRERIHLARLGIRPDGFEPASPVERGGERGGGGDDGEVVIGYLARICPEKGLHQLVEAFGRLAREPGGERLRLRVAGYLGERDRPYLEEQRRRVAGWGLAERVDFVGEVDREGKLAFLRGLDLFSVPTVYREPKGLFVVEALMSGVPVVLPRHGAFPEWIESTGGGILVDPDSPASLAQGLARLVADPDERRRLGRRGREAALERHDHRAMARDVLAVYERVLAGEPQAAPIPASP